MPRSKSGLQRSARLTAASAIAALALAVVPAGASAADCPLPATSPAFAMFGDRDRYYLAPGGSFEAELTWAKSASPTLVAGNELFNLAGLGHDQSLRLESGDSVRTPKMCVSPDTPHMRFVAEAAGSGQLDVEVRLYDDNGRVTDSSSGGASPSSHRGWAPSRKVDLKVDRLAPGETGLVDVRFRSQGEWHVDDVFVDPRARG